MDFIKMMLDPDMEVRERFWELWMQLTPQERNTYDRIALRASVEAETEEDRKTAESLWHLAEERLRGVS